MKVLAPIFLLLNLLFFLFGSFVLLLLKGIGGAIGLVEFAWCAYGMISLYFLAKHLLGWFHISRPNLIAKIIMLVIPVALWGVGIIGIPTNFRILNLDKPGLTLEEVRKEHLRASRIYETDTHIIVYMGGILDNCSGYVYPKKGFEQVPFSLCGGNQQKHKLGEYWWYVTDI